MDAVSPSRDDQRDSTVSPFSIAESFPSHQDKSDEQTTTETVLTNTRTLLLLVADTTSQLHISRHDRHTLGVNSAQVGILEQ